MENIPSALGEFISRAYEYSENFGNQCMQAICDEANRIKKGPWTEEEIRAKEFIKKMSMAMKNKMEKDLYDYLVGKGE